ncbi:hypothetical protein YC2023_008790 [Brassica napus]
MMTMLVVAGIDDSARRLGATVVRERDLPTNYNNTFSMHNPNNARGDAKLFAMRAMDSRIIFYAAGEKKLGKNKLYAMVQCLEHIKDCKSCLTWSISKIFENNNIKQGGRVLGTECDVRYELYPFLRS